MVKLKVTKREQLDKKDKESGLIAGVVYGKKLKSTPVFVEQRSFEKVYEEAGENVMVDLDMGDQKPVKVLIREIQTDPLSDEFVHVDFFAPRMDKKVEAEVELDYIGESPAVKSKGGILVKSIDVLNVRCLPEDLPERITVDVSALKTFDDAIKISDLNIGENVETLSDPETVVAVVSPPRSEEELEGLDEAVSEDVSKVEVEGEKEKEEGENEEAEKPADEEKEKSAEEKK